MIAKIRMTQAEYEERTLRGEFEGERIELIFGEIIPMSPQSNRHIQLVRHLNSVWNRRFDESFTIQCQLPLQLPWESSPEPDLSILAGNSADLLDAASTALAVIEVSIDSLRFDRTTKRRLYALAGIPEYWIINAIEDQIEVHRQPEGEEYRESFTATARQRIAFAFHPELTFSVAELLLLPNDEASSS